MKKQTSMTAALLIAALTLAGCANKPASTTAAAEAVTTTAAETTTTAAETTTASETTAAETTADVTTAEDNSGKTAIFTALDGTVFYRENGTVNEYGQLVFPGAIARVASGMYITSDSEPDSFIPDEFIYNGSTAELGDMMKISAGDTVCGYKIKEASTSLTFPWDPDKGDFNREATEGYTLGGSDIFFEDDVTLTGILRYYFDEQYAISSGDIQFIPDESYKGMPIAFDISGRENNYGVTDFDAHGGVDADGGLLEEKWGGNICVYSDANILHLGNLKDDYSDRTDLYELLDGANANCTKKVEVTISGLKLRWNETFGAFYSCEGKIKSMKTV